jgi:hypothetical protein
MPALVADDFSVLVLEDELRRYPQLEHLSVRKHGPLLILESGPKGDRFAHARFRRVTRQWLSPELPGHDGRWGRIPVNERELAPAVFKSARQAKQAPPASRGPLLDAFNDAVVRASPCRLLSPCAPSSCPSVSDQR